MVGTVCFRFSKRYTLRERRKRKQEQQKQEQQKQEQQKQKQEQQTHELQKQARKHARKQARERAKKQQEKQVVLEEILPVVIELLELEEDATEHTLGASAESLFYALTEERQLKDWIASLIQTQQSKIAAKEYTIKLLETQKKNTSSSSPTLRHEDTKLAYLYKRDISRLEEQRNRAERAKAELCNLLTELYSNSTSTTAEQCTTILTQACHYNKNIQVLGNVCADKEYSIRLLSQARANGKRSNDSETSKGEFISNMVKLNE
jgi:hypothetical protein